MINPCGEMSQGLEEITWFSGGLNPIQEHGPSTKSSLHLWH